MMDISQLRYFAETAKLRHFAHAAEQLGITQSALSRSIQKLEAELGFPLFSRSNKWNVQLTVPGEIYLQETLRILRDLGNAQNLALTAQHGEAGRLVIGTISSMLGQKAFIDTMAEIRRKTPGGIIEILDSTSGELPELLKAHRIDLAFLRLGPDEACENFTCRKLFLDKLLLALPRGHRLCRKTEITVADLAGENFVLVPETVSAVFRNYVLSFCREKGGFEPKIIQEVSNNYTALRLVAAGCGITLVSSAYEGTFGEHLRYCRITGFQPELPMFSLTPAERIIPLAERFIRIFLQKYGTGKSEVCPTLHQPR